MGLLSRCVLLGSCLIALNGSALTAAVNPLNPIVDGALTQQSITAAQLFQDLWAKQMGNGRCMSATSCEQNCTESVSLNPNKKTACEAKEENGCYSANNCKNVPNSYEVWADAFGHWGRQEARQGFTSYQSKIFGGMLGFQAPLGQLFSVGGAAGYAHTQIKRTNPSSIQSWDGTVYASFNPTNFYADAALSASFNEYKDDRNFTYSGFNYTARANYHGQQYTGLVSGGYRYFTDYCLTITPMASLQYSYLHVNDYNEVDAGVLNLDVESQEYSFLESGIGMKLSGPFQSDWGVFIPEIHGLWFYDYFGDEMDITSKLAGITSRTTGPSRDRNWGDIGVGLTYYSCSNLSVELVYNHEFSKTYYAQEGMVKVSQRF